MDSITAFTLTLQNSASFRRISWLTGFFGTANQDIGLYPVLEECFYGMLCRLGLEFTGYSQVGEQRQVNYCAVASHFPDHLADGFNKGKRFDITYRSADFCDHNFKLPCFTQKLDTSLDLIRNVRNYLDGFAKIGAITLFVDNGLVNTTGGNVIGL